MIVILGNKHDDILYFETILKNKVSASPIFDKFPIIQGTIFNQEITLCYGAMTSYLVGPLTELLIKTYKPMMIIQVGRCKALTEDWKNGDIAIASNYLAIDVDQCEGNNVKLGQIPELDNEFLTYYDVLTIMNSSFDKFLISNAYNAVFMSTNAIPKRIEELHSIYRDGFIFGHNKRIVIDSDSFSSMAICQLERTPFIAIKAIDSRIGESSKVENFLKTLDAYSKIGKAVASFIGEIGRHDLRE